VKLPRNVTGRQLAAALAKLGYATVRQRGSHIHLVTQRNGEHHVVVPEHSPLKPGTLNAILRSVAEHHGLSRDELIGLLEI
jgi:predicted RNA binding protein YcfA (HicA-like mRNA interferase family)